jgi:TatA/E family protein of Tat protein translocase
VLPEMTLPLAFIQHIGPVGFIVIAIVALLIFGKRLPDVARNLGKGIVEFKKGVKGIEDDVDDSSSKSTNTHSRPSVASRANADDDPHAAAGTSGASDDRDRSS